MSIFVKAGPYRMKNVEKHSKNFPLLFYASKVTFTSQIKG